MHRGLVVLIAVPLLAAALAGCGPVAPPGPTPSADGTPGIVATPSTDPSGGPTDEPESPVEPVVPDPDVVANVRDSVTSGDTRALASWMAPSVEVILAASECCGAMPAAAAAAEVHNRFPVPGTEWDFDLDPETIAVYRDGDYATWIPVDALVGRTLEENPQVIALTIADGRITSILFGWDDVLSW